MYYVNILPTNLRLKSVTIFVFKEVFCIAITHFSEKGTDRLIKSIYRHVQTQKYHIKTLNTTLSPLRYFKAKC